MYFCVTTTLNSWLWISLARAIFIARLGSADPKRTRSRDVGGTSDTIYFTYIQAIIPYQSKWTDLKAIGRWPRATYSHECHSTLLFSKLRKHF